MLGLCCTIPPRRFLDALYLCAFHSPEPRIFAERFAKVFYRDLNRMVSCELLSFKGA
jgi:hypothetical protein